MNLRKFRLKFYKRKKVKQAKSVVPNAYFIKFKMHLPDQFNSQVSKEYEIVVPARAAFFAKIMLERSIKEKISIEVLDIEKMSEEEFEEFEKSREEYLNELI